MKDSELRTNYSELSEGGTHGMGNEKSFGTVN